MRTLILTVTLLALAACNTVDGIGKDMEAGGRAIQNSSGQR